MVNNIQEVKLLEPKKIEVEGKDYFISKFPAFDGYEIMVRYIPVHFANINGDFEKIKEMVVKVMKFVAVEVPCTNPDGTKGMTMLRLENETLINNHCSSGDTIMQIVAQMMDYNTVFFKNGKGLTFFQKLEHLAEEKITAILTAFAVNLSQNTKQRSGN